MIGVVVIHQVMAHLADVADLKRGGVIQLILRRKVEFVKISWLDVLRICSEARGQDGAVVDREAILHRERSPAAGPCGRGRRQQGEVREWRIINKALPA